MATYMVILFFTVICLIGVSLGVLKIIYLNDEIKHLNDKINLKKGENKA